MATKQILVGLLWICSLSTLAHPDSVAFLRPGQSNDTLPAPPDSKSLLFYIQRTSNTNTILYDVNMSADGKVDDGDPIHVYWVRYAEEGQQEELSYVQRNFAYGINAKLSHAGVYEFSFVSYKKMKMYMQYSEPDKRYIVYMMRAGKKIRVSRFFVKIDGGTFWFPKVTFIEIKGIDMGTGKGYLERFKP